MNSKDLFKSLNYIDEDLIREAEFGSFPEKRVRTFRRPMVFAAIVTLMVMLMGSAVVALNMKDITLGQLQGGLGITEQMLTMAGLEGTPAFMAAQEWYDFKQTYEFDTENPAYAELPEEYYGFGIYTKEMKDKLDEILAKYNLNLPGKRLPFETTKVALEALGMENILVSDSASEMTINEVQYFENGNLNIYFTATLSDKTSADCYLYYRQKDSFIGETFVIKGDNWREWNYTTASGHKVLILRSPDFPVGWIFCDMGEHVAAVPFEATGEALTDQQVEMLADSIDFAIKPILVNGWENLPVGENVNGYSVYLKSAQTDGYTANIILGITAPEGTALKDYRNVSPGNWNTFLKGPVYADFEGTCVEDGDGLDNTMDFVIKANGIFTDGRKAFTPEAKWCIYFEDICGYYWDATRLEVTKSVFAEGTWVIEFSFAE